MYNIEVFTDKGLTIDQVAKISFSLARGVDELRVPEGVTRQEMFQESNELLREAFRELTYYKGRPSINMFQENKHKLFLMMGDVLQPIIDNKLNDYFSEFAEIKNAASGDNNEFYLRRQTLFNVTGVSDGNWNIRRQKLYGARIVLELERIAVKVYEEINRFIDGTVDWAEATDLIALSMANEIATRGFRALADMVDFDLAQLKGESTGFDEDELLNVLHDVNEQAGVRPVIYGTERALSQVSIERESPTMREERSRDLGYYGMFRGYDVVALPFSAVPKEKQKDLFILPTTEDKPIKVFVDNQNDTVYESTGGDRLDEQQEMFVAQYIGVGAIKPNVYGVYRINE